jgi:hypothetical protein
MTQHYIVGQFSMLLGELQPASADEAVAVGALRRRVETSRPWDLRELARQAAELTDSMCWAALGRGDVRGFAHCAQVGAALWEFRLTARLIAPSDCDCAPPS